MNSKIKTNNSVLLAGVMFVSLILAYLADMQKMGLRWDDGDNSYCYLIVPLVLYLLWDKRGEFDFGEFAWSMGGLIPLVLAFFLALLGAWGSVETLVYVSLWLSLVGIAVTLYGARVKRIAFSLLILAFLVPMPPFINRMLTFQLKMVASTLSVKMLRLTGYSVLQEGNIIDVGVGRLQVVDACSGLRYFMPMVLIALLVGYFFSRGGWRRTLLLVLVVPLAVALNALRIYLSGVLTVHGHAELAQSFFHDLSGLVLFLIAGLILVGVAKVMEKKERYKGTV